MAYKIVRTSVVSLGNDADAVIGGMMDGLELAVAEAEGEGWRPLGGPLVITNGRPHGTTWHLAQAMTKTNSPAETGSKTEGKGKNTK